jgi:hypothetical protein
MDEELKNKDLTQKINGLHVHHPLVYVETELAASMGDHAVGSAKGLVEVAVSGALY